VDFGPAINFGINKGYNKHMIKQIVLALLLLPVVAMAHGVVTTQTQTHEPYTIEFEYNTIGNIKARTFNIFNVYLLDKDRTPVDFDNVYINISTITGDTVLVGTIKEVSDTIGTARLGGIIDKAGEYVADIQFTKDGKILGPYQYKFTVDSEIQNEVKNFSLKDSYIYIPGILSIIGFTTALVLKLRTPKKKR
jgi:hypothetical protein